MEPFALAAVIMALICVGVIGYAFYGRNKQEAQWERENSEFFAFTEEDAP